MLSKNNRKVFVDDAHVAEAKRQVNVFIVFY
jgi:hypothetical protein